MSDLDEIKEREAQAEELMENLRKLTPEQIRAFRNMIIGVATMNDIMAMDANFDDLMNSTIYILDHSKIKDVEKQYFNISGDINDPKPKFGKINNVFDRVVRRTFLFVTPQKFKKILCDGLYCLEIVIRHLKNFTKNNFIKHIN